MPTFHTTVSISGTDHNGYDYDCEVEVSYTFDGGSDELPVITSMTGSIFNGYDDDSADDRVYDAICELCGAAYRDWQNDHGDYLLEQRRDARMDVEMGQ